MHALIRVLFLCLFVTAMTVRAENWPGWRGPRNDGVSLESHIPAQWDRDKHIAWRLELPGPGPSTPVVWGDRIFLTSANEEGHLLLISLDLSGKKVWERDIEVGNYNIRQGESNAASSSPSTDGRHVWSFFGTGTLICHDIDGNEVWRTNLQDRYEKFSMYHGMSTTPLLDGDRLYIQLLHTNAQYVLALDKMTGKEIWRHQRASDARQESLHSYASPIIYRFEDLEFLVTHGSDYIVAHNLKNGGEIWRSGGLQKEQYNPFYRFVTSPVAVSGLIVAPSAKGGPVLGIKPKDAEGDITGKEAFFAWKKADMTPDVPSPVIHDGLLYLCRENGLLICVDIVTGEEVYKERTHNYRHRGSPVYADGKVFLMSADGKITVVKAGRQFEVLAQNDMEEQVAASLAVSNQTLFLRTYKALYAIKSN